MKHLVSEWRSARIKDLVGSLDAGVSVNGSEKKRKEGEIAVLKVSAVSSMVFRPEQCKPVALHDLERVKESPKKRHIIISRSNTSNLVGASALVRKDYPSLFLSDKLWQIKLKPSLRTSVEWLALLLVCPPVRYRLSRLATGTSGSMKNISKDDLLTLPIEIPPPTEQKEIARGFRTCDRAISLTERLIAAKLELRKGLMQQLLSGKRRFPGFTESWTERKLGALVDPVSRPIPKPLYSYRALGIRSHFKGTFERTVKDPGSIAMDELYVAKEET